MTSPQQQQLSPVDHPHDEVEQPPEINRGGALASAGLETAVGFHGHASAPAPTQPQQQQQQMQMQMQRPLQPPSLPPTQLSQQTSALASKPHAFDGAVLSPDHARNLTADLTLQLASALSLQASQAASSRGLLPPGEIINFFSGSGLVDILTGGSDVAATGSTLSSAGAGVCSAGNGTGVFRPPPLGTSTSTPGTPKSNAAGPSPRVLQLLHHGGVPPTPSKSSTPGAASTPGASNVASAATSPNTPTDQASCLVAINPLSLLSTAEALESFASWRTHYTVWITEAWNILQMKEPSAALFWEMATMFHTLYVASLTVRGGGSGRPVRERVLGLTTEGGAGAPSAMASSSNNPVSLSGTTMKRAPSSGASAGNYIPPLLSCGSQSSMGSVRSGGHSISDPSERGYVGTHSSSHQQLQHPFQTPGRGGGPMKPARHSAKELPVWLISMFLLAHCETDAFLRCTSGEDERRFSDSGSSAASPLSAGNIDGGSSDAGGSLDFAALLHHRSLSPRTRLHATAHQNNANCASYLLRHLRKFLLLCAVPRNVAACKAVATLAARGSARPHSNTVRRYSNAGCIDIASIEGQHAREHGDVGINVELSVEELDRLHLVLQAPSGGLVDEPPIAIGEHILSCLAEEEIEAGVGANKSPRWHLMQDGLVTVGEAERVLRKYLEEELTMAKQELEDGDGGASEDVVTRLSRMSLGSGAVTPLSPPRSRGVSLATDSGDAVDVSAMHYFKELSYQKLRSTTVLLEPGVDAAGLGSSPTNCGGGVDGVSVADSQSQTSRGSSSANRRAEPNRPLGPDFDGGGRLHDLHIADCSDTHFYLLQPFEHATIAACTDCTIVLGAVAGLLHVVDCERTMITSAARRVVVSNSFDVIHYLFTPSPPLLVGDNRGCQFAPYNTYYEGLRDDLLSTGLAAVLRSTGTSGGSTGDNNTLASPGRGSSDGGGRSTSPSGGGGLPTLQCASNKWKVPIELCKLEVPQLPIVQTPGSPNVESSNSLSPGADDRDVSMKTPILLPPSEFDVLLVPVESEEACIRRTLLRESQGEAVNARSPDDTPAASSSAAVGQLDVGGNEVGEAGTVYSATSSITGVTGDRTEGKGEGGNDRFGLTPPPLESDYCRILADLLTLSPFHMPHEYERRVIAKAERVKTLQHAITHDLNEDQKTSLEEELNRGFQDWLVTSGNIRQILDLIHLEKKGVA